MFISQPNSLLHRRGLTLVEVMIAMVMTLVVLGAMMSAFSYGSAEMQKGRAAIELNNRLVTVESMLRRDLDRITVEVKPHFSLPAEPKGYLEIIDGVDTDYVPRNDPTVRPSLGLAPFDHGGNQLIFGDRDDYFACTIKSDGQAFRGRFGNEIVESHLAEVVWFTVPDGSTNDPDDALLVRRQLLILPEITASGVVGAVGNYDSFLRENDISIRRTAAGTLVANSLTELSLRANRFSHSFNPAAGPNGLDPHRSPTDSTLEGALLVNRFSDDHVMISSIAAFDIQVFDPDAYVRVLSNGEIVEASDIGAKNSTVANRVGVFARLGGFIDLGKGIMANDNTPPVAFADAGILGGPPAASSFPYTEFVYDTGTSRYNRRLADHPGANGIDDDSDGRVDEPGENKALGTATYRKVVAPYNVPLRGVRFSTRVLEPNTKQVRQMTVNKSFVAE